MVFRFFQYNVHLNLKTDEMFDIFFGSCINILAWKRNNYKYTQKHICETRNSPFNSTGQSNKIQENIQNYKQNEILNDSLFWLSISLLLILFVPTLYVILRYNVFSNLCKYSSYNTDLLNEFELKKSILKHDSNLKDYQKEKSVLGLIIENIENVTAESEDLRIPI
jgi:hypothetical protein